ncbi:MAG: sigma-70 family RNA polymerase sigma factor [bacterium]
MTSGESHPEFLDTTALLLDASSGSARASDRLLAVVYDDLRGAAARLMRGERSDHTLRATELVHEAYLRLVDHTRCEWQNRAHFLAVASRAMRNILVDHARRRGSHKRGGDQVRVSFDEALVVGTESADAMLLTLERGLEKLALAHPEAARVVEMRFFGGLTNEECASVMGFSARTVSRNWEFAQAWLYREIATDAPYA